MAQPPGNETLALLPTAGQARNEWIEDALRHKLAEEAINEIAKPIAELFEEDVHGR